MLTYECYKTRLEKGLSFLEFNYNLMQSYDFLHLFQNNNVVMELGGDDQWSNILGGVDLVRRVESKEVYGMTFTLLTTKEGKKMGKTEKGALFLDPEKCAPYEFYQYFRNIGDDDVINCLKLLTFLDIEKIEEMERTMSGSQLNTAKEILAFELTKMVHGEEEAQKAQDAARAVFGGTGKSEDMPSTALTAADFTDGKIGILDLLVKTGLAPSKSEARRLVQQGGISADEVKITDPAAQMQFSGEMILKKGKKVFHRVYLA